RAPRPARDVRGVSRGEAEGPRGRTGGGAERAGSGGPLARGGVPGGRRLVRSRRADRAAVEIAAAGCPQRRQRHGGVDGRGTPRRLPRGRDEGGPRVRGTAAPPADRGGRGWGDVGRRLDL